MTIKVGERVPSGSFTVMTGEGPKPKTTDELFKGKKVVLFAVPGAFTPTCHKITCRVSSRTRLQSRPRASTPSR